MRNIEAEELVLQTNSTAMFLNERNLNMEITIYFHKRTTIAAHLVKSAGTKKKRIAINSEKLHNLMNPLLSGNQQHRVLSLKL